SVDLSLSGTAPRAARKRTCVLSLARNERSAPSNVWPVRSETCIGAAHAYAHEHATTLDAQLQTRHRVRIVRHGRTMAARRELGSDSGTELLGSIRAEQDDDGILSACDRRQRDQDEHRLQGHDPCVARLIVDVRKK